MTVAKQRCLPTYLLIDVSGSMQPHQVTLNNTLNYLHGELVNSPRVSEFAHISIVAFSNSAWLVLGMTDMYDVPGMPEVTCEGQTNYGAAFRLLRERIDVDIPALVAQGKAVMRPCVFMLTDGAPNDADWQTEFANLTGAANPRRPHVITYGFGSAPAEVLARIATKAAFLAEGGGPDQDEALARAINSLLNTLVASARSAELQIPTETPGYRSIPVEFIG